MPVEQEFPFLAPNGLYAAQIKGDGNCLFNALSDQIYGSQDQHAAIRSRVIQHMTIRADYYKQFLEVYPGGGTRRNPKRKNAGSSAVLPGPTAEDVDRVFEEHVARMARGGTWGDNMEIQAFAEAFETNVQIYQREVSYMIQAPGGTAKTTAHIAYHTWEHYSSIRNVNGPHNGLPDVTPTPLDPAAQSILEQNVRNSTYAVPSWQIESLSQACPTADSASLKRALEATKGDVDTAFERLMAGDDLKSVSSQQSSSVDREAESDDDDVRRGSNKRQDRRMSRNTKALQNIRAKSIAAGYDKYKDSLDNLVNAKSSPFTSSRDTGDDDGDGSSSEEGDSFWEPPPRLTDGSTSAGSDYSPPPEMEQPKIKIKLSLPKKEEGKDMASNASRPVGVQKKPISAQQKQNLKKQAQKQASKERKQAVNTSKKGQSGSSSFEQSNHPTLATSAMRTLWI